MASRKQGYAAVAMKPRTQKIVERIAKSEGRKFTRQAEILVELGLAEYERQQKAQASA